MSRFLNWLFPRYVDQFEAADIERPKPENIYVLGFGCNEHGMRRIERAANRRGVRNSQLIAIAVEELCNRDETGNRCQNQ